MGAGVRKEFVDTCSWLYSWHSVTMGQKFPSMLQAYLLLGLVHPFWEVCVQDGPYRPWVTGQFAVGYDFLRCGFLTGQNGWLGGITLDEAHTAVPRQAAKKSLQFPGGTCGQSRITISAYPARLRIGSGQHRP